MQFIEFQRYTMGVRVRIRETLKQKQSRESCLFVISKSSRWNQESSDNSVQFLKFQKDTFWNLGWQSEGNTEAEAEQGELPVCHLWVGI